MTAKIPATATVDALGSMVYEVEVTGALAYSEHRRIYTLKALSEKDAAMRALEMFVDEMHNLEDAGLENE